MNEKSGLRQVFDHRWSTIDWTVAQLTVWGERIAAQQGLTVENWNEDGRGDSTGCSLQLPSVRRVGIERLLSKPLVALGLDFADVEWRNDKAPTVADAIP